MVSESLRREAEREWAKSDRATKGGRRAPAKVPARGNVPETTRALRDEIRRLKARLQRAEHELAEYRRRQPEDTGSRD
jgi:hypothetical protein